MILNQGLKPKRWGQEGITRSTSDTQVIPQVIPDKPIHRNGLREKVSRYHLFSHFFEKSDAEKTPYYSDVVIPFGLSHWLVWF